MPITIRNAERGDAQQIFQFICDLAAYENAIESVECDAEGLAQSLFDDSGTVNALILEEDGLAIGYAVYFYNYSTWTGTRGIYLEDLYVDPAHRGKGAGLLAMKVLAHRALAEGCKRFEWAVLDWNRPSIDFYETIGASHQHEWLNYRLDGKALETLACTDTGALVGEA